MTEEERRNQVSGGIIGELIQSELPFWSAGVCRVEFVADRNAIVVYGEGDHSVETLELDGYKGSSDGSIDLEQMASDVNGAIQAEHDRL